jgi:hypothetical protein
MALRKTDPDMLFRPGHASTRRMDKRQEAGDQIPLLIDLYIVFRRNEVIPLTDKQKPQE